VDLNNFQIKVTKTYDFVTDPATGNVQIVTAASVVELIPKEQPPTPAARRRTPPTPA